MSCPTSLSTYIKKLTHPIKEIRERSLKLLLAKYKLGWEMEDDLSCSRDLFQSLLYWFQTPQPSMQKEALCLLLSVIKTQPGIYIAKEQGINNLLASLNIVKYQINDPVALEIYDDIINTLKFVHTVESNDNIDIPALDIPSLTSSESGGGFSGGHSSPETKESSKESFIINMGHTSKNCDIDKSDGIKILLFPWVEISTSDLKTVQLIEDALKLLKSVRRCCRFIRDVFLRDFPAELFLNRPAIVKNLLVISEKSGNQSEEALCVLSCITEALLKRLKELYAIDLIHNSNKFSENSKSSYNDDTNFELEQLVCNGEMKPPDEDNSLAALRQLPAPLYTLDTMNNVLSSMIKNIEFADWKIETVFSKETNACVHLVESLIQLLLTCVSEKFWTVDHSSKTQRDIAHKSCIVMRLLGELLIKYRKIFVISESIYIRAVWLRLVLCAEKMLNWASESALPPSSLLNSLHLVQLDPAVHLIYPRISDRITMVLQRAKTTVDHEYKTKYRELMKLTACMEDAVRFMKNKNNCRTSKAVLACIKSSLPVLELHMSQVYLDDVADILLFKSNDLSLDDNDWSIARNIATRLMAHNVEWVRVKFYAKIEDLVKLVFVGDEDNQSESEKCLTLLFDVGVLTEICCHGLSAKTKQVEVSSNEIMLYLLRGRLILSEPCWWRLLASLLPVLPLLHVYAAHDTQLGKAICKSLELDIASCMGVCLAEVTAGLTRLLFVRCVAVQLDAAHSLCRLLDDNKYLPPKEALRADVLMNALRRVKPEDFNIDSTTSPRSPQVTGLLQILDVLKQDITLDEHGTDYLPRDLVQPILEPSLRRSTLQQLAVLMRQQDAHDTFLKSDGLRIIIAILRMSLMVDDYLAFPECAISCLSILNSVCFVSRHNLAKITDLIPLVLRVILVFPANDSVVSMCAQLLCLITWSGFVLQELDMERKRVPALPACVTARTVLPFKTNSYWNTSTNAEHSAIEWLSNDEEYRNSLRVRWWCAFEGVARVCRGAPPPPAPVSLQPTDSDRTLLKATCLLHSTSAALLGLENATSHTQVAEALSSLECYLRLIPWSSVSVEEYTSLPWHHMRRFLRAPPASLRDTALLIAIMRFILGYLEHLPNEGSSGCWVKDSFIDNDTTVLSLLSREQLLPQQTSQESIEVAQLHTHIVKVLRHCVKRLEYQDYDSNKLESLLKILLSCLDRIDLKNFHALGYLNELMRCVRYVLHSRYCKLSEDTNLQAQKIVTKILSGCAAGGGRKGQACRLDSVLSLLALLLQVHEERIPVQRWSELWHGDVVGAVVSCSRTPCPQLRATAISTIAALAHYPQLLPQLLQATREESLAQCAAQIFTDVYEANIVRAAAAELLTAVSARSSPHCELNIADSIIPIRFP